MEENECVYGYGLVFKNQETSKITVYSGTLIANSYKEAIGIALEIHKDKIDDGEVLIAFDADRQNEEDLWNMMILVKTRRAITRIKKGEHD